MGVYKPTYNWGAPHCIYIYYRDYGGFLSHGEFMGYPQIIQHSAIFFVLKAMVTWGSIIETPTWLCPRIGYHQFQWIIMRKSR